MPEVQGIEQVQHFLRYRPIPALEGHVIDPAVVIGWMHLAAENHPETGFSIVDSLRLEDFIMRHTTERNQAPLPLWRRVSRRLGLHPEQA